MCKDNLTPSDNLENMRFDRLTAINLNKSFKTKYKRFYEWNCKCDCGKEMLMTSDKLISKTDFIKECPDCAVKRVNEEESSINAIKKFLRSQGFLYKLARSFKVKTFNKFLKLDITENISFNKRVFRVENQFIEEGDVIQLNNGKIQIVRDLYYSNN